MVEVPLAYILDLIFGDPARFPHPVRAIGWAIQRLERICRRKAFPPRMAGVILTCLVVVGTYLLCLGLVRIASSIYDGLGFFVSAYLIYTALSIKGLDREARAVRKRLERIDLDSARVQLSKIVGRDTHNLDHEGIVRAAVESVAENTSDGVIAPLFYAFVGGAPLAFAYKAINTLDSMIGYKSRPYLELGWASARLDDVANFLPARISGALIFLAAWASRGNWKGCAKTLFRDARKHPSPNSGIPEAAVAGALGIQLGGLNYYQGLPSQRPFLGDPLKSLRSRHISEAIRLMYTSSALMLGFCILIWTVWHVF